MLRSPRRSRFHWSVLVAAVAIMLIMTACGGGDEDPTPEPSPTVTVAAAVEPTATSEPEPTETPTPEPTATPTAYAPAPTVAAPLYEPPAPPPAAPRDDVTEPTPTDTEPEPTPVAEDQTEPTPVEEQVEPPPDPEVPDEADGIGELLLSTDLRDSFEWENDIGWGYVSEEGFNIVNTDAEGRESWDLAYAHLQYGNIVASVDVRNVGESASSIACLAVRTGPGGWDYAYALCLSGFQESFADFKYVDGNGEYLYEELVEFGVREGTLPANEWNRLTIVASGQDLGFLVNDELIGTAIHPSVELGGIAFAVGNYEAAPAEWVFTNLEVWEIQ